MEIGQKSNPPVQCRLCGNYGDHRFEIFDSSARNSSSSLSEKILRCLDIEVISSDPTTVICAECFNKLFGYDQFREVCHATNRKIKIALSRHHNGIGNGFVIKSDVKRETNTEPIVTYVLLDNSDSEPNGKADELASSDNLSPKIEQTEVDSDEQMNDSAESSADEIPVFASTSSTFVKHECPETAAFSPKLEMIEIEQTVDFPMDASENDPRTQAGCVERHREVTRRERIDDSSFAADGSNSKTETDTDSDGVDDEARVPPKRVQRKAKVTVKKEHNMNKKTKKIVPKFPIKCSFGRGCQDSFESREAMRLHVKTYHEKHAERTFCCHLCKKTVTQRKHLIQHMNTMHTQMVRFKCPNRDCSKMFTQKCHLNAHINAMHKNQVAFKCPKCSNAFFREHLLKKHLAIAHGDGIAFACVLCEKSFTRKGDLKRHIILTHTKVTLYECPEATCSKSFKRKSYMKRHIDGVHSEKKLYECTKCPAKFGWKRNLQAHLLRQH